MYQTLKTIVQAKSWVIENIKSHIKQKFVDNVVRNEL